MLVICVFLLRWITIEHRWSSVLHCQGPTPTQEAPPNYLKVKAKQATLQAANSTLLGTTKPPCTTILPCKPVLSTSPLLLTWAPSASPPAPTLHLAGAPPQTSSPLGYPMNSSGLPYNLWSVQATPGNIWITLSKLERDRQALCALQLRSTQESKWLWRKWTSESNKGGNSFLMR